MKRAIVIAILIAAPRAAVSHETLTTTVLFDREIVRILNKHCVMCHVENGPSFPLATYEQAWLQKRQIRTAVIARHMPPWAAVSGYGQFANDNSLTLRETQFIVSWVEGLGPRNSGTVFTNVAADPGSPKPAEIRAQPDFANWRLGEPSAKLALPPDTIEPAQPDQVKRVVIDTGFKAEQRLSGIEFMPGDRRVMRAAVFTIQETGQWIGSWTPWYGFMSLPKGASYRLPAGAHIAAEIHYRGAKERIIEKAALGLFFAQQAGSAVSDLTLEAKGATQKLRATSRLASDTQILALRPDIQPGLKSIEVSARKPDGSTEVLLFAKDFSSAWPSPFILKDPVTLPRGAEISAVVYFAGGPATSMRVTLSTVHK